MVACYVVQRMMERMSQPILGNKRRIDRNCVASLSGLKNVFSSLKHYAAGQDLRAGQEGRHCALSGAQGILSTGVLKGFRNVRHCAFGKC